MSECLGDRLELSISVVFLLQTTYLFIYHRNSKHNPNSLIRRLCIQGIGYARADPLDTPDVTGTTPEYSPSRTTVCDRLPKQDRIQYSVFPLIQDSVFPLIPY